MNADDGLPDRRCAMTPADIVAELEHTVMVLELRVDLLTIDLDALAAEVAELRRRRWWR
jgi:hypothetical protein